VPHGALLFSNRDASTTSFSGRYTLAPYEGVVVSFPAPEA
jgi:hypothetical protein